MTKKCYLRISILLVQIVIVPFAFAQDSPQLHLPEGAKFRLGKGTINDIAYSADSKYLAVASSIGIWIYDAQTGEELNLLKGHTGRSVVYHSVQMVKQLQVAVQIVQSVFGMLKLDYISAQSMWICAG